MTHIVIHNLRWNVLLMLKRKISVETLVRKITHVFMPKLPWRYSANIKKMTKRWNPHKTFSWRKLTFSIVLSSASKKLGKFVLSSASKKLGKWLSVGRIEKEYMCEIFYVSGGLTIHGEKCSRRETHGKFFLVLGGLRRKVHGEKIPLWRLTPFPTIEWGFHWCQRSRKEKWIIIKFK